MSCTAGSQLSPSELENDTNRNEGPDEKILTATGSLVPGSFRGRERTQIKLEARRWARTHIDITPKLHSYHLTTKNLLLPPQWDSYTRTEHDHSERLFPLNMHLTQSQTWPDLKTSHRGNVAMDTFAQLLSAWRDNDAPPLSISKHNLSPLSTPQGVCSRLHDLQGQHSYMSLWQMCTDKVCIVPKHTVFQQRSISGCISLMQEISLNVIGAFLQKKMFSLLNFLQPKYYRPIYGWVDLYLFEVGILPHNYTSIILSRVKCIHVFFFCTSGDVNV